MSIRPRLKSHAQPLRRGPGSLQLGLSPDAGIVLDGLSDAEIALAEGLDGSLDLRGLFAVAASAGIAPERLSALIATLSEHHLLVEVATGRTRSHPIGLARARLPRPETTAMTIAAAYGLAGDGFDHVAARSTRHVVIGGEGDLPEALAELLRAGGIGQVSVGADAANTLEQDLRGQGVGRSHPRFRSGSDLPVRPDLVVLAAVGAIHANAGEPWRRHGIPHLPLVVQAHRVHLGPLITAGAGPCLSCMDLHRRDKDADWPVLLSQLAPQWPLRPGPPISLESTLTAVTVGVAAMLVHAYLDGQAVPNDLSMEVSLPWPAIVCRRWYRHPLCGCRDKHATMAG